MRQWRRVIWTDECYIWLGKRPGRVYITRRAGEEYLDDCLVPKFDKKDSVMVWGGILGEGGKKVLVIWERDDWGTISASTYINNILIPTLQPFWWRESNALAEPLWVTEDNAPAHRAAATKQWQEDHHMDKLSWLPASPDLNPIENLWAILKGTNYYPLSEFPD